MVIVCPSCEKKAGSVESVARLILTAHCPFCGLDFGVAVDPRLRWRLRRPRRELARRRHRNAVADTHHSRGADAPGLEESRGRVPTGCPCRAEAQGATASRLGARGRGDVAAARLRRGAVSGVGRMKILINTQRETTRGSSRVLGSVRRASRVDGAYLPASWPVL